MGKFYTMEDMEGKGRQGATRFNSSNGNRASNITAVSAKPPCYEDELVNKKSDLRSAWI